MLVTLIVFFLFFKEGFDKFQKVLIKDISIMNNQNLKSGHLITFSKYVNKNSYD